MPTSRGDAESALYGAIKACAESAKKDQDGTKLKVAAEAFEKVAHGPQGGDYTHDQETRTKHEGRTATESTSVSSQTYSGKTDYHETRHGGEDREKPPTGFSG